MTYPIINLKATQQEFEEVLKLYALGRMGYSETLGWLKVRCGSDHTAAVLLLSECNRQTEGLTLQQVQEACAL